MSFLLLTNLSTTSWVIMDVPVIGPINLSCFNLCCLVSGQPGFANSVFFGLAVPKSLVLFFFL